MSSILFEVTSKTSGALYQMVAWRSERGFHFSCSCPAGEMAQMCKHRSAVLDGVFPSDPAPDADSRGTFKAWLADSNVALQLAKISAAEDSVKQAQKQAKALKAELGRMLSSGDGSSS